MAGPPAKRPRTAESIDAMYFDSYSSLTTQRMMLEDEIRTEAYRAAIDKERFEGKTVLDVGCGTGILSIFAAKAGAKQVFAVEGSKKMADLARKIVKANGLQKVITVFHSKVEDVELPRKVDILVSEWMGYCLLYEGMFESVLRARDKWLKPSGLMLPERVELRAVPFTNPENVHETRQFWQGKPYGVDYGLVAEEASYLKFRRPIIEALPEPECQLSQDKEVWDIDCGTIKVDELLKGIDVELKFECIVNGDFHGVCFYFDCYFGNDTVLKTGPDHPITHWYQTCVYLAEVPEKARLFQDDVIKADILIKPKGRALDVIVNVDFEVDSKNPGREIFLPERAFLLDLDGMELPS